MKWLSLCASLLLLAGCSAPSPQPTAPSPPPYDWSVLEGHTKAEVLSLHGEPPYKGDRVWKYSRPGNIRMVVLHFDGDKVQRVSK